MVYDSSMEWSYRVRYVRFVGHVIPALRLATYMLTQYQQKGFIERFDQFGKQHQQAALDV